MPSVKPMITAAQVKAARALLGLSQGNLAAMTGLGIATIKRLELSTELRGAATTLWTVQTALEEAGVEFLQGTDQSGPGVRLKLGDRARKQSRKKD
jgi:transcriptional regulator with XRE-family HTH domain